MKGGTQPVLDDRFNREEELFQATLAVAPGGRSAFLDKACGDDDELRARLEALIRWDERDTADVGVGKRSSAPPAC